jgi:hypothetical protein
VGKDDHHVPLLLHHLVYLHSVPEHHQHHYRNSRALPYT